MLVLALVLALVCLLVALLYFSRDANRAGFWTWLAVLVLVLFQLASASGVLKR